MLQQHANTRAVSLNSCSIWTGTPMWTIICLHQHDPQADWTTKHQSDWKQRPTCPYWRDLWTPKTLLGPSITETLFGQEHVWWSSTVVSLFYVQLNSCHLNLFFRLRSWICRYEQELLTWAAFRETRRVKNRDKGGHSPQTHRHRNHTPRHLPSVGIIRFLIKSPVKNRTKFTCEFRLFPNQSPADEICWFIGENSWVQGDSEKTSAANQTQSFQPKAKDAPVFSQGPQKQTVLKLTVVM